MAKSIRNISSQPRSAAPALHTILLDESRSNSHIRDYFHVKKSKGTWSVPKPILSKDVIAELRKIMDNQSDEKVNVQIVIICLDDFSTNAEVIDVWSECYEEISQLLCECLNYLMKMRKNHSTQNTLTLKESLKILSKFCTVLTAVADKSELLSTSLFNKCAENLLILVFMRDIGSDIHIQGVILLAVSILCHHADRYKISDVFKRSAMLLKYLARIIIDFPTETQMSIYNILTKSLTTQKEAAERAPIWFYKWPALQDAFIECTAKHFSEGCGRFLDKLYYLRSVPIQSRVGQSSTSASLGQMNVAKANNETQRCSEKNDSTPSHAGKQPTRTPNTETVFKTPTQTVEFRMPYSVGKSGLVKSSVEHFENRENSSKHTVSLDSDHVPKLTKWKGCPTPYPQHRKNLSLQKQSVDNEPQSNIDNHKEPTQPNPHFCKKGDFEKFDISPKNKLLCCNKESNSTAKYFQPSPVKTKANSMVQSNLSNIGIQEGHSIKVERWLTGLKDDDLQVLEQSDVEPMLCYQEHRPSEKGGLGQKRPSSVVSDKPKRWKEDSSIPPVTNANSDYHHPSNIGSNSCHVQFDSIRGTRNDHIAKIKVPIQKMNEVSVILEKRNQATEHGAGKKNLFTQCLDNEEMIKTFCSRPQENQKKSPLQENIRNFNDKKRHWEQKVRELHEPEEKKLPPMDIYSFHMTQTSDPFKIPKIVVNKKRAKARAPSASKGVKSTRRNDENACPKNISNEPILGHKLASPRNLRSTGNLKLKLTEEKHHLLNNKSWQNSNFDSTASRDKTTNTMKSGRTKPLTPYPKKEAELKLQYYSPVLDDSMESTKPGNVYADGVDRGMKASIPPMKQDKSLLEANKSVSVECEPASSAKKNSWENVGLIVPSATAISKPNLGCSNRWLSHDNLKQRGTATLSSIKPGLKLEATVGGANKSKELDSGIEASTSEALSSSSREAISKERLSSANEQYLKMRIRDYLQQTKESNSAMTVNQTAVSSEIMEIKGLAEKISASAARCHAASDANQLKLREQSTALEKCSKYLGPFEDQSFKAQVPATKHMDFKEFKRQIRAKNAERMRKALQTVLDNDYSLSPSSSESR